MTTPSTCVIGLGNVLMGDDGVGTAVVRAFETEYTVPPDVTVVDLGNPGHDLSRWLADAAHVIIVDAVTSDLPPGTLRLYKKADLLVRAPSPRVSSRYPGLQETLVNLEIAGRGPLEVALLGVVPASSEPSLELSPAVKAAVPVAVQAVVAALERCGIDVTLRPGPPRRAWWVSKQLLVESR